MLPVLTSDELRLLLLLLFSLLLRLLLFMLLLLLFLPPVLSNIIAGLGCLNLFLSLRTNSMMRAAVLTQAAAFTTIQIFSSLLV